jgi:Ni,Fe-hydrogenase I cytochrome b subunit
MFRRRYFTSFESNPSYIKLIVLSTEMRIFTCPRVTMTIKPILLTASVHPLVASFMVTISQLLGNQRTNTPFFMWVANACRQRSIHGPIATVCWFICYNFNFFNFITGLPFMTYNFNRNSSAIWAFEYMVVGNVFALMS